MPLASLRLRASALNFILAKSAKSYFANLAILRELNSFARSPEGSPKARIESLAKEEVPNMSEKKGTISFAIFDHFPLSFFSKSLVHVCFSLLLIPFSLSAAWPDGSAISPWFTTTAPLDVAALGKPYVLTSFGITSSPTHVWTKEIQHLIDTASASGGGVIVVPAGEFVTGGLHFKPGTHLRLEKGATLLGNLDTSDYPSGPARIEGQNCDYTGALINADGLDGFTISGFGTIDGRGLPVWKAFWKNHGQNKKFRNKDLPRPRVLFVSNCRNVRVEGVTFQDSAFWTTHYYKCTNVKILNCTMRARVLEGVKGPSTDGIDLDVVTNALVKGCFIDVNDDGVCLKGGKGAFADDYSKFPGNGDNLNILVEDCTFGPLTHTCLTCGSESVHNRNVILRNSVMKGPGNGLFLKMRVDTPQHYEYITVDGLTGHCKTLVLLAPWAQYADCEGRTPADLMSRADHVTVRNCNVTCSDSFVTIRGQAGHFTLSDFTFADITVHTKDPDFDRAAFTNLSLTNVTTTRQ